MTRESRRICDQCGGEIPAGAFYRILYCKPEVAEAYLGHPSPRGETEGWSGTLRIHICQACSAKAAPALNSPPA